MCASLFATHAFGQTCFVAAAVRAGVCVTAVGSVSRSGCSCWGSAGVGEMGWPWRMDMAAWSVNSSQSGARRPSFRFSSGFCSSPGLSSPLRMTRPVMPWATVPPSCSRQCWYSSR